MNGALHPWRKRFWTLIALMFGPIAAYSMRARARACGCDGCRMMLAGPRIIAAIRRAQQQAAEDATPVHNPRAN